MHSNRRREPARALLTQPGERWNITFVPHPKSTHTHQATMFAMSATARRKRSFRSTITRKKGKEEERREKDEQKRSTHALVPNHLVSESSSHLFPECKRTAQRAGHCGFQGTRHAGARQACVASRSRFRERRVLEVHAFGANGCAKAATSIPSGSRRKDAPAMHLREWQKSSIPKDPGARRQRCPESRGISRQEL